MVSFSVVILSTYQQATRSILVFAYKNCAVSSSRNVAHMLHDDPTMMPIYAAVCVVQASLSVFQFPPLLKST